MVTLRFLISMGNMSLEQWLPTAATQGIFCGETHPGIRSCFFQDSIKYIFLASVAVMAHGRVVPQDVT